MAANAIRLAGNWHISRLVDRASRQLWQRQGQRIFQRGEDDVFAFVDVHDEAQHIVVHGHWQWVCTCSTYALSEGDCPATVLLRLVYLQGDA